MSSTCGPEGGSAYSQSAEHIREELLHCKGCHNPYTAKNLGSTQCTRLPKVLPCSHTFCEDCVKVGQRRKKSSSSKVRYLCSLCGKDVCLPKGGVQGLKDNTTIVGLLNILEGRPVEQNNTQQAQNQDKKSSKDKKMKNQVVVRGGFFKVLKRTGRRDGGQGAAAAAEEPVIADVAPAAAAEEPREEPRAEPAVYTGSQLYPQLHSVRFEEPPAEADENQPPPYRTLKTKAEEAAEAEQAQRAAPQASTSLYPNLAPPSYEALGRLEVQRGYGGEGQLAPNAVPLPGLANPSRLTVPQSMRVTSPGRRTLERRLGGSMRDLPSTASSPELQCSQGMDGALRCAVNPGLQQPPSTTQAGLDLARPMRSVPASQTRVMLNTQQVRTTAQVTPVAMQGPRPMAIQATVPAAVPSAVVRPAATSACAPAARPANPNQRAPHVVINMGKPNSQSQTPRSTCQPNMAKRQVVFLNQTSQNTPDQTRVQLNASPCPMSQPANVSVTPVNMGPVPLCDPQPVVTPCAPVVQPEPASCVPMQAVSVQREEVSCVSVQPVSVTPVSSSSCAPCAVPPTTVTVNGVSPDELEKHPHTPLNVITKFGQYCERKPQPGGFQLPSGISVTEDNGNITVVDTNLMTVQVFSSHGKNLKQMKVVGIQCACMLQGDRLAVGTHRGLEIYAKCGNRLHEFSIGSVTAVTSYGSGVLVVQQKSISGYMGSDLHETQQLRKRTKPGSILKSTVGFQRLVDIAVTSNKELVVLDAGSGEIYVLSDEGNTRLTISPPSLPCGRLLNPSALALDHLNNIYVCDTGNRRVLKFDGEGRYCRSLVNFTLGATSTSPCIDNTLTAYGVAIHRKDGHLILTVGADKMAQVRIYQL